MKSFYTIVKIITNPIAKDSMGVGLILSSHEGFRVLFSSEKMNLVKKLLGEKKGIVNYVENQISQKIKSLNEDQKRYDGSLFTLPGIINEDYFRYLNTYCNNILQFTEPKVILDEVTNEKFDRLFSMLVSHEYEAHPKKAESSTTAFHETIEKKLISRVSQKVHVHQKFSGDNIPNLYFNYELDCIGLNGGFACAKSLSFDQNISTLRHKTSDCIVLMGLLDEKYKKNIKKNNVFIIADEPNDIASEEHEFWEKLRQLSQFKLINSEESDIVAELIEKTGATTFLS